MILKQFLGMISPTTKLYISEVETGNLLNKNNFYLSGLEAKFEYLNKQVLSIEPIIDDDEKILNITIDTDNYEPDDELLRKDLEDIQDLLMESADNYEEDLYNDRDMEFMTYYERKLKRFKELATKIDIILEDYYE